MELNKISEEIDKRFFLIVSDEIYFLNSFVKSFKKIVPNEFKDFNEYTLFADEIKFQDLIQFDLYLNHKHQCRHHICLRF